MSLKRLFLMVFLANYLPLHATLSVYVTPFDSKKIPKSPCFETLPTLHKLLEKNEMEAKWTTLQDLPKKRHFLRRILYAMRKTPYYIFNNYYDHLSKTKIAALPQTHKVLLMWEPPSVLESMYKEKIGDLFGKILTWNDDLLDGEKFFKMQYPVYRPMEKDIPAYDQRKLLCMIASNIRINNYEKELYSLRKGAAEFFERKPEGVFDLYGRKWEKFKNQKGIAPDKMETLKKYRFSICFENCYIPGYITEKIFDCFAAGTVPIYLGASNVERFIPPECFIDFRKFGGFEEMLDFVQNLEESAYQDYLLHIREFLEGEQAKAFTEEAFSENLFKILMAK